MHAHYGDRWPLLGTKEDLGSRIAQLDIQRFITQIASSNVVLYLHPSFGYFFEKLYPEPQGQIYRLRPYEPEEVFAPALTAEQLQSDESFWQTAGDYIKNINRLREYDSADAHYVAQYYSRALNTWGVDLQRAGKLVEAGKDFDEALRLNTNNVPAKYNGFANKALQTGDRKYFATSKNLDERFGIYRTWDSMLGDNGPFDHPEYCQDFGSLLLDRFHYRQAALQFSRVIQVQPTNFVARIALAKAYVYGSWIEKGLAEADKIEKEFQLPVPNRLELASLRAAAYFTLNQFDKAEHILQTARETYPNEPTVNQALFELYRTSGRYTNALAVVDEQLVKTPTNEFVLMQKAELQLNNDHLNEAHSTLDDVPQVNPKNSAARLYHAFAYIQQKKYDAALSSLSTVLREDTENIQALTYEGIAYMEQGELDKAREAFDRVLSRQPENVAALRNRAILNLRAHHWVEAKEDYERLLLLTPRSHAVFYGLAEIAYNDKDYREAARLYEKYLKYAPSQANSELLAEKKKVEERLNSIQTAQK
jgi:tetratricopeptide (TPR) repeat protein